MTSVGAAQIEERIAALVASREELLAALKALRAFAINGLDECNDQDEPGCVFCVAKSAIANAERR